MDPDHVAAQVRERSGLDVQAVTLVRSGAGDELVPWVWAAMTEHGHFWAVEDGETLELFRAVARRTSPDDLLACHSAVEAARRFLLLHPRRAEAPAPAAIRPRWPGSPARTAPTRAAWRCQVCGTTFTRRRQVGRPEGRRAVSALPARRARAAPLSAGPALPRPSAGLQRGPVPPESAGGRRGFVSPDAFLLGRGRPGARRIDHRPAWISYATRADGASPRVSRGTGGVRWTILSSFWPS